MNGFFNMPPSLLSSASDITIFQRKSAEYITKRSKKVMATMGEWELLDITSHQYDDAPNDSNYIDHLDFHVG